MRGKAAHPDVGIASDAVKAPREIDRFQVGDADKRRARSTGSKLATQTDARQSRAS
jgi:hypothetical protein